MIWIVTASVYAVMSAATFGAFAFDKARAQRGDRRVPERSLHTLEMLGGWPGALLAMRLVRHKNRKASYWLLTVVIVLIHIAAWAAAVWVRR